MTNAGVLLGTASYMSPEQARGKTADKRADVWAFGVVLFEMLSGARLFEGETISDTLAAVLRADPDWTKLPEATPAVIRRLLVRCLQRDPHKRLPDIGAARLELQELLAGGAESASMPVAALPATRETGSPWMRSAPWLLAALLGLTAAFLGWRLAELGRRPVHVLRATIAPPPKSTFNLVVTAPAPPALSPDGTKVAFGTLDADGKTRLYVRRLDAPQASVLTGTEDAVYPFWAPDSRMLGFFSGGKLRTIDTTGGPPISLCNVEDDPKGGAWSGSGVIVFAASSAGPLQRVPATGGEPAALTKLDAKRGENSHRHPRFLPDGTHFLYVARMGDSQAAEGHPIVLGSLDGGAETVLLRSPSQAVYASGHLLFMRERTLMARRFDARHLQLTGEAFPVADGVRSLSFASATAVFSASDDGLLAFVAGGSDVQTTLRWLGRDGNPVGTLGEPGEYTDPAVSPDGSRVAVELRDDKTGRDIWVFDVARGIRSRFTFDAGNETYPVFSPDARTLYYASSKKGHSDLYRKALDGSAEEELLYASGSDKVPFAVSPDEKYVAYLDSTPETKSDIWVLPLSGERKPQLFLQTKFTDYPCAFSPDGKWLAYGSDESGKFQIYVTSFPKPGRKWQVSSEEGAYAQWSADGKEIVYHAVSGELVGVPVLPKPDGLEISAAHPLAKIQGPAVSIYKLWSAPGDMKKFLVNAPGQQANTSLDLVVNWPAALKR
jgi:Tol biopolymer transport system component